eukprot:4170636-Pyramimonas_sp.AAC.1
MVQSQWEPTDYRNDVAEYENLQKSTMWTYSFDKVSKRPTPIMDQYGQNQPTNTPIILEVKGTKYNIGNDYAVAPEGGRPWPDE